MILGWPTFKIMCNTPFSINFRCQIENQVSDYRLLGASSFPKHLHFCIFIESKLYMNDKMEGLFQILQFLFGSTTTGQKLT
jgi:hypothetical protein